MTRGRELVEAALEARAPRDADRAEELLQEAIGGRYERPIGDRWNNLGAITASGASYDHKVIELMTNMQDAVVELDARRRHGRVEDVPYASPQEAAGELFRGAGDLDLARRVLVELHKPEGRGGKQRVTLTFRDGGCGMTPGSIPKTIFHLGSGHKHGVSWLQGTFGMGGITTYRNADAVILVTRRHPALLEADQEDLVSVAIVRRDFESDSFRYLVSGPFDPDHPTMGGMPYSVPASEVPDFEPGTYLALISYQTEGYHRERSGDEKSLDTVVNTRLFRPPLPTLFVNHAVRSKEEGLRGLDRRLRDNPRPDRPEGKEVLPVNIEGATYRLPVRYWVFGKPSEAGERRNFVARDHVLILTSNGQVHKHWTPQEFRAKTALNKLYNRIFVEVETDALPVRARRDLFTADRSDTVRTEMAIRLENEIIAFLNDQAELRDLNDKLIEEAVRGTDDARSTISIAQRIARAMKVKGFSLSGAGTKGGGKGSRIPRTPDPLYLDPTHMEGPDHVVAVTGSSKGVYFTINAVDGFIPERAQLEVELDHPDINGSEVSVGDLKQGRIRVSVAVPEGVELGTYLLRTTVDNWLKSSGGTGPRLTWDTKFEVLEEAPMKPSGVPRGGKKGQGDRGADAGELVAVIWDSHESDERKGAWTALTVGEIELVEGRVLADLREEYAELAKVEGKVPTILLNREFKPLKDYVSARAKELSTEEGRERLRERYAVGTGVGLLELYQQVEKRREKGEAVTDEWIELSKIAAARSVLSVMPEFDALAKEAGLEELYL